MMKPNYNPDVLTCLANLSNDEVFTPPDVVNRMLDLLPPGLWSNPSARFLDPVSKTGVFLREIARRLITGLAEQIPDIQERANHIFKHQLFGLAITELTGLVSRRSVYCSKTANGQYSVCTEFDDEQGNIIYEPMRHEWQNGRCRYCGASREVYERDASMESHAYQFIHTDNPENLFPDMRFDVIIGNPPYQLSDGGNGASAKPIYHLFVEQAMKLKPRYLVMIIPARWYAGGKGLNTFRNDMLNNSHIKALYDYSNSADCFPSVNIAGGVCYFLWDREYCGECSVVNVTAKGQSVATERTLNEYPIFVRDNFAINIIRKIQRDDFVSFSTSVYSRNQFGLSSNERGHKDYCEGDVTLFSSDGQSYISKSGISDGNNILNKYKVIITYAMSGGNKPSLDGNYQIISSLKTLKPNEVCTETYLVIGVFDNEFYAKNMCSYVKTKLFRFLLLQALTSIHITKDCFVFVPMQDFGEMWTDKKLYNKYKLSVEEINFIELLIKNM